MFRKKISGCPMVIVCFLFSTIIANAATNLTVPATKYAGTDPSVKINACISAVIASGGGTCDASGLGGSFPMSEQIDLGTTASVAAGIGVTLLLPDIALWQWDLKDSVSCGIRQYSSTALIGHQPAGGGQRMVLSAKGGSNMDSIYCTDAPVDGANYIRAEDFAVENNQPGSTFENGIVHIRDVVDQSSFSRIFAENYYGDVWHIDSACCGANFNEIQGTSNGATGLPGNGSNGGTPLTVGPGKVTSVAFRNSGFNAPGVGFADIHIQGYGFETLVLGVDFYDTYMEGNGTMDQTTPMVLIDGAVGPVHFIGGTGNTEQSALKSTKTVFRNSGYEVDVTHFQAINTTLGINDLTGKVKVAVWQFNGNLGLIPAYQTTY
jgi:hypothetical protein